MYRIFLILISFQIQFLTVLKAQDVSPLIYSDSLLTQGLSLYHEGKYEEALKLYEMIPEGDSVYLRAGIEKVNTLNSLKRYDVSKKLGHWLISQNFSEKANAYNNLGTTYDQSGDPDSALFYYEKGIEQFPYYYLLYYNKGVTLTELNRYNEAVEILKTAIKINPFHANSHYLLASIMAKMGYLTKCHLSLSMYIALAPTNNRVLVDDNNLFLGSWDIMNTVKGTLDNSDFDQMDLAIKSNVATSDQFKSSIKFTAPVVQQSEFIMEVLKYNKDSEDFWMQFYVPLFKQVYDKELTAAFIYHNLKSTNKEEVNTWIKKHDKELNEFYDVANIYLKEYRSKRKTSLDGKEDLYACQFYKNNLFNSIGNTNSEGKNIGPWEYYYANQQLQAKGSYNDNGIAIGRWAFYYQNSILLKIEVHDDNGNIAEPIIFYYDNGKIKNLIPYKGDNMDGLVTIHDLSGVLNEEITFDEGIKNGKRKGYYPTGGLHFEYEDSNDSIQGEVIYYYPNGKISEKYLYDKNVLEGPYSNYFADGKPSITGQYSDDNKTGDWVYLHHDGSKKSMGTYTKGMATGTWTYYNENGQISSVEEHESPDTLSKVKAFDTDGKLYYTLYYDEGTFTKYEYFNKNGEVISSAGDPQGNFDYNATYPDGSKWITGKMTGGKKQGTFVYFRPDGNKKKEIDFKDDEYNGHSLTYDENGQLTEDYVYEMGVQNGYVKTYYENGQVKNEGWVLNDDTEQVWKNYFPDGTLKRHSYLLNDQNQGPVKSYDTKGRLETIDYYDHDLLLWTEQYDTLGKMFNRVDLDYGNGQYILNYVNGAKKSEMMYKGGDYGSSFTYYSPEGVKTVSYPVVQGVSEGSFVDHNENGTISEEGQYLNDDRNGEWKFYTEDGVLESIRNFSMGANSGKNIYYYDDGTIRSQFEYKHDDLIGIASYYSPDGTLQLQKNYNENGTFSYRYLNSDKEFTAWQLVGYDKVEVKCYFPNGQPSAILHYNHGIYNGKVTFYATNGQILREFEYKAGDRNGAARLYYSNGKKRQEVTYVDNKENGKQINYYPDGTLQSTRHYFYGILTGEMVTYDANGHIKEKRFYRNDSQY